MRQGAPSSSLLFIVFVNELIGCVKKRCIAGEINDVMHILLHADDIIVLGMNLSLLIHTGEIELHFIPG